MKYQIVLQHSEEDCGAACLATIAKHYGRIFNLNRIREGVGTGWQGTTLLGLRRGAESLGFKARQVKASSELVNQLNRTPLPAIIHWKGDHWVVLYGQKGKKYIIGDPAVGIRYLHQQELIEGWLDRVMLLLSPDGERFYQQSNDKVKGFSRFLVRVLPYRYLILEAIAINFAIGLLSLAMPIMMQLLTDDVLVRKDLQLLTTVSIAVIALNLFQSLIDVVQSHIVGYFSQRLQLGLILDYGYKLLHLPLSYFDTRRSGEVVSRIDDAEAINDLVEQVVLSLPSEFFIAVISLGLMLFYSWKLTLASILGFILLALVNLLFLPAMRQKTQRLIVEGTENQGFLVETFNSALVLKTTQATPQAWSEYQQNFGRLANLEWGTMKLGIYSGTVTEVLSHCTSIGLLWIGSYLVIGGTMSIGQLIAFNGMSGNFLGFLGSVFGLFEEFITAQIVIQRLSEVLDATPEEKNAKPWVNLANNIDLVCTNINFHHPGRTHIFQDFNLTIPGGQVIAVIGQSGCGKSTLVKLLAGLYPVNSGNIRYGIYNHRDISLECLRQQVVLIPQEPRFLSRSILNNFLFSYPNLTFEQIVKACQISKADEFISQLPENYHTILGEFGTNLSGGQKQRLAIARAIANDPPVLILDESTAALDPILEAEVLEKLLAARQGKTTILISHRPSAIARADSIILLDRGKVHLQGSLEELLQIQGNHLKFLTPHIATI